MSSALNTILPTAHRLKRLPNAALAFLLTAIFLAVQFLCDYLYGRIPWHDSKAPLDAFHTFYTLWQQTGTYPAWIDYGVYGYPIYFIQSGYLNYAHFIVACVGLILGIKDTLALFYAAVLLNHLIFLTGLFLLGTALFRHWASIALLVIVGGLSASWLVQSPLNFTSQHTLPLILYFLVVGLRYRSLFHLILAGVVAIAVSSATAGYVISIQMLSCEILLVTLLYRGEPHIRSLLQCCSHDLLKLKCVAGFAALVGLTALMAAYIKLVIDNTALLRSAGTADRIVVPLKEFLTQGPNISRLPLLEFLSAETVHGETTFYFGLVPFALFIAGVLFALRRKRSNMHKAFLVLVLAMVGLTAGGVTATLYYFIPPMPIYHNIGHVYAFVRLFMIIAAAFGLDQALIWLRSRHRAERLRHYIVVSARRIWSQTLRLRVGALVLILIGVDIAVQNARIDTSYTRVWIRSLLIAVSIMGSMVLALLFHARWSTDQISAKSRRAMLLWILLVGMVVSDLTLYQFAVFKRAIADNSWIIPYYHSRPWPFVPERVRQWRGRAADDFREWQARRKLIANNVNYETIYPVFGVDPCLPSIASDVYERSQFVTITSSRPVAELIKLRGGEFTRGEIRMPPEDRWLNRALACESPKFWVTRNVFMFATVAEMQRRLADSRFPSDWNQSLVVAVPATSERATISDAANVVVESYVPQRIRLAVEGIKTNAWLVTSIPYHSGWTARVDGAPRSIAPANGAFFALPVTSSDHFVELEFHDVYGDGLSKIHAVVQASAGMMIIALGLTVMLIGLGGYRPKSVNLT